jgi:hypothetical protein
MQHTNTFLYLVKTQASQLNINITIKFSQSSTKKKNVQSQLNSNMIRLAYFNSKFYNWKSKFVCRREPKFWNPNFELKILCSCLTTPPFFPKLGPALLVSCKQKENAGEHAFISCISQTKTKNNIMVGYPFSSWQKEKNMPTLLQVKRTFLCVFFILWTNYI